jgi:hypothetical protein
VTTIAYRDGVLAADTLCTANGLRDDYATKIWRHGKVLIGGAGSRALCLKFRDWVVGGMEDDCPIQDNDDANGILVTPVGVVCWSASGPWPVSSPFYALGSGYQVAMGAMQVGATAEQAVEAALRWDTGSGGEVHTLSL